MSMTVYFFFSRFDPASVAQKAVGRFHQNAGRTVSALFHQSVEAVYTGTFRTDGSTEVYIHICDDGQPPSGSLSDLMLKERILTDINALYAAAGLKRECPLRGLTVRVSSDAPENITDKSTEKEMISEGEEFDYTARAELFCALSPRFSVEID